MSTTKQLLSCIEIEPITVATHSVIWMHGLGADGNDFVSLIPELHLPKELGLRFIFPNAPVIPVTINGGYEMRAWYDVLGFDRASKIDESGIIASFESISALIKHEIERGIAASNIIIAGFSQGAVMALTVGLRYPEVLGGIIALSGYLPLADQTFALAHPDRRIPIFLAHGTEDTIVDYTLGMTAYSQLKEDGFAVSWHPYPMAHSVCLEEVQDISKWLLALTHNK